MNTDTIDEIEAYNWEDFDRSDLEGADIIFATYMQWFYDGRALVVYRKDGQLYAVESGHCSWHGMWWSPQKFDNPTALIDASTTYYINRKHLVAAFKDKGLL